MTIPAASVTAQMSAGETPTFAVFGKALASIAFNPGLHRAFLRFLTPAGGIVGGHERGVADRAVGSEKDKGKR